MAHGAGGKATQTLIEGLLVPAFGSDALAALGDAGLVVRRRRRPRVHHGQLRREAAPLPRRLDRRAGRQRHRQRPGRGRRAAARADARDGARGGPRRRRPAGRGARRSRPPRRAAGVQVVAGDTKVVERGHGDGMYLCTAGIGARRRARRAVACGAASRATGSSLSGTIGDHGTAIMLARGEFELDAAVESDTRSLWPAADALLGRRRARRCTACATRRAAGSPRC